MQKLEPTCVVTAYVQGNNFLQSFVDVKLQYNEIKQSYHLVGVQGDIFHGRKVHIIHNLN